MSFHLLTKVQIVLLSNLLSPNLDDMDLPSSFLPYINYYWLTSERFQVPDLPHRVDGVTVAPISLPLVSWLSLPVLSMLQDSDLDIIFLSVLSS